MTLDYYRGMLTQRRRIEAFRTRLGEVVRPGDRVLEIGAGLGTYSFFAVEAGAGRVVAVEGGPIVHVARAVARHNGLEDRVEFVRGWFPGVTVPEPVDVAIYENYPPRLFDEWTYHLLARLHALLAPGGRLVPERARLYLAPVESPRNWRHIGAFGGGDDRAYGIDWTPTRSYICNTPLTAPITPDELRHDPACVADLDLTRLPTAEDLTLRARWEFAGPATVHGLLYWFELEVGSGVWLTNRPGGDPGAWGHVFLPVATPFRLAPGDVLDAVVSSETGPAGAPRWLRWEVSSGAERFAGHEFASAPASRADVLRGSPTWVPALSRQASLERDVLALTDGRRSVDVIARTLVETGVAPSLKAAHDLVLATLEGRTPDETRPPGLRGGGERAGP